MRPQRGERLMFTPGPSTTDTPVCRASAAMARPMAESSSTSQLLALVAAVGKQVAGTLSPRPMLSPVISCLRRPWGPSDIMIAGIPSLGMGAVCH